MHHFLIHNLMGGRANPHVQNTKTWGSKFENLRQPTSRHLMIFDVHVRGPQHHRQTASREKNTNMDPERGCATTFVFQFEPLCTVEPNANIDLQIALGKVARNFRNWQHLCQYVFSWTMPHILSSIYVSSPSFKMGFGQTHDKVSGGWQPLVAFFSLGV